VRMIGKRIRTFPALVNEMQTDIVHFGSMRSGCKGKELTPRSNPPNRRAWLTR
jgi:hypothetical protein